ncbi:MAG: DUF72 domain-containing protein [Anaerolineales bacterium]
MKQDTRRFWIGTSGWSYDHWWGDFYPTDLPKNRWFSFYLEHFAAVEINATFYRIFADTTYHKWREQVTPAFRYVLKVPKLITHRKCLQNCEADIRGFNRSANLLGECLGMLLLQVSPITPFDLQRLREVLQVFDDPTRIAVEFRSKHWECDETRSLLCEMGAAWVSADSPRTRLTDWVTGRRAYIRLHGRRRWYADNYSMEELEEIAQLAQTMTTKGAQEVYIFFNNDFGGYAPKNALTLARLLC